MYWGVLRSDPGSGGFKVVINDRLPGRDDKVVFLLFWIFQVTALVQRKTLRLGLCVVSGYTPASAKPMLSQETKHNPSVIVVLNYMSRLFQFEDAFQRNAIYRAISINDPIRCDGIGILYIPTRVGCAETKIIIRITAGPEQRAR